MNPSAIWVAVGLLGQVCFFSRSLLQWLASERARRSVVPTAFWKLSVAGAGCVLGYAVYRGDPVFVLGMLPSTCIYVRNLVLKGRQASRRQLLPVATAFILFVLWAAFAQPPVDSGPWIIIGMAGSVVWSCRYIVQWWISERRGVSVLPTPFWMMSLVGNVLLLAYALHKKDPVFIPGQSIGFIVYLRNLWLIRRADSTLDQAGEQQA